MQSMINAANLISCMVLEFGYCKTQKGIMALWASDVLCDAETQYLLSILRDRLVEDLGARVYSKGVYLEVVGALATFEGA